MGMDSRFRRKHPSEATLVIGMVDRDSSMGSVLMEMLKKLVSDKNSFTMELMQRTRKKTGRRCNSDRNEQNHAAQLTARPDPYRRENLC